MQQVNVKFNDVEQIRQFIKTIDKFDTNFDLGSGHRVVDATFSMAAQVITPILSGFLLEHISYRTLFPYAVVFSVLA